MHDPNGVTLEKAGWKAKVKGGYVWGAIIAALLLGIGWREFDRLDQGTAARTAGAMTVIQREHAALLAAQERMIEAMEIQNYITALPADERPRLLPPAGISERLERVPGRRGR